LGENFFDEQLLAVVVSRAAKRLAGEPKLLQEFEGVERYRRRAVGEINDAMRRDEGDFREIIFHHNKANIRDVPFSDPVKRDDRQVLLAVVKRHLQFQLPAG
jgi:hypothetical protein